MLRCVLEVDLPRERAALDLFADRRHAAPDRRQVGRRDDARSASIAAWARLPAMSARHRRWSNATLAV
jgi:hypothetical protein